MRIEKYVCILNKDLLWIHFIMRFMWRRKKLSNSACLKLFFYSCALNSTRYKSVKILLWNIPITVTIITLMIIIVIIYKINKIKTYINLWTCAIILMD